MRSAPRARRRRLPRRPTTGSSAERPTTRRKPVLQLRASTNLSRAPSRQVSAEPKSWRHHFLIETRLPGSPLKDGFLRASRCAQGHGDGDTGCASLPPRSFSPPNASTRAHWVRLARDHIEQLQFWGQFLWISFRPPKQSISGSAMHGTPSKEISPLLSSAPPSDSIPSGRRGSDDAT